MRYQVNLEIDAPRDRVVELFLDTDNLKHWQPSLVRFETINGGAFRGVGAQSRQLHRMGKREVDMIATITVENYPDEFSATYEAEDMWNLIQNQFEESGESTRWTLISECRSSSWFMKILMALFPGMFKKADKGVHAELQVLRGVSNRRLVRCDILFAQNEQPEALVR